MRVQTKWHVKKKVVILQGQTVTQYALDDVGKKAIVWGEFKVKRMQIVFF